MKQPDQIQKNDFFSPAKQNQIWSILTRSGHGQPQRHSTRLQNVVISLCSFSLPIATRNNQINRARKRSQTKMKWRAVEEVIAARDAFSQAYWRQRRQQQNREDISRAINRSGVNTSTKRRRLNQPEAKNKVQKTRTGLYKAREART